MIRETIAHRARAVVLASLWVTVALSCSRPSKEPTPAVAKLTNAQERGSELYGRMCSVCHGAVGQGYVADQAPAIGRPAYLASVTDDFLRTAIAHGRRGTTMSAWSSTRSGPLMVKDIDAVIAFIRTWDKAPRAVLDERPITGNVQRGAELYAQECVRCHGAHGIEGPNIRIGDPELLASASHGLLRHAIAQGRPDTIMPGFASKLGAAGVEDVVALLRSFGKEVRQPDPAKAPPPPLPLGPVPLNPEGPEPQGFRGYPKMTSVDKVHTELKKKARMVLLDARAPSDYLNEHIQGAVSVPFYDPNPYLAKLPKDAWLVCYCACPHAESSRLAEALLKHGFPKVTVLDEGLLVWKARGYELSASKAP